MSDTERKQRKKIFTMIYVAILIGAAAFFFIAYKIEIPMPVFIGAVTAILVIFWTMMDIVEPRLMHDLEELTPARKTAYFKYVGLGAAGYAALGYFVIMMGEGGDMAIWGAVIYALAIRMKNQFRLEYRGLKEEE